MPPFSAKEGSEFLFKMLARGEYSESEKTSAKLLSENLGGLPLALHLMGIQIDQRGKLIEQFLSLYRRNSRRLHNRPKEGIQNIYYSHSLDTVWQTSFQLLSQEQESKALMGILSFLSPDDIPESLFHVPNPTIALPPPIEFCLDEMRYVNPTQISGISTELTYDKVSMML